MFLLLVQTLGKEWKRKELLQRAKVKKEREIGEWDEFKKDNKKVLM